MGETKIEWTSYRKPDGRIVPGYTFNSWEGCTKVSPGCQNCYAEARDKRLHGGDHWGPSGTRLMHSEAYWAQPQKWNVEAAQYDEMRFVFSLSLGDWLEDRSELVTPRARLLWTIGHTSNLFWLLLTKHPEDWERIMRELARNPAYYPYAAEMARQWLNGIWPRNVGVGTSVENQKYADLRIPQLAQIPAELRFLSAEPLLGSIKISKQYLGLCSGCQTCEFVRPHRIGPAKIGWIIAGGESGPNARPMHPQWAREIRDQCQTASIPFFFKQWGSWLPYEHYADPPFMQTPDGFLHDSHGLNILDPETGEEAKGWDVGWWTVEENLPACCFQKVGKEHAGNLLDGRQWLEMPK